MVNVQLFSKTFCLDCHALKKQIDELEQTKLNVNEFNLDTFEGLAESLYYQVFETPTVYINEIRLSGNVDEIVCKIKEEIKEDINV